jgi:hypothetical protein
MVVLLASVAQNMFSLLAWVPRRCASPQRAMASKKALVSACRRALGASLLVVLAAACGAPRPPVEDVFSVQATVGGLGGDVDLDFVHSSSQGEWWPCDARLNAQKCYDDAYFVSVLLGLPGVKDVGDLGGGACIRDVDGKQQTSGAYEILRRKFFDGGHDVVLGEELSAFILVAADQDGDGVPNVSDPREVKGVSEITAGTIDIGTLENFDTPFSMRLVGENDKGPVTVEFRATMTVPDAVRPLAPSSACSP